MTMNIPVRYWIFLVAWTVAFTGCVDIGSESTSRDDAVAANLAPEAAAGSRENFTGITNAPPPSAKEILTFGVGTGSGTSSGTITGTSIGVTVPPGVSLTSLVAAFIMTGTRVTVGGVTQVSGTTPNDFTNPVIYTVTAADGTTKDYTVILTPLVTGFSFTGVRSMDVTYPSDGVNPKLTTPPVMSQVGVVPSSNAGFFGGLAWTNAPSADPGQYFSFTVSPVAGETMTLSTLSLQSLRSGPGPLAFSLRSSLDDFAADIQAFSTVSAASGSYAIVLPASFVNLTTAVEFRLYAFAATSLGYWRIDNVRLGGSIVP